MASLTLQHGFLHGKSPILQYVVRGVVGRKRLMYQLRVQQLQQIHRALGNTDLEVALVLNLL